MIVELSPEATAFLLRDCCNEFSCDDCPFDKIRSCKHEDARNGRIKVSIVIAEVKFK